MSHAPLPHAPVRPVFAEHFQFDGRPFARHRAEKFEPGFFQPLALGFPLGQSGDCGSVGLGQERGKRGAFDGGGSTLHVGKPVDLGGPGVERELRGGDPRGQGLQKRPARAVRQRGVRHFETSGNWICICRVRQPASHRLLGTA
jgi:hypothetical protein